MKAIVATMLVSMCSVVSLGQHKLAENDPQWRQQTVQRAFNEVSAGLYTSWSEKYLARLGDSSAPEIMKLVASRNLTKKDAETVLSLVKMSFANPRLIRGNASKTPTNTLTLLEYLTEHTVDGDTRSKISFVRNQMEAQSSGKP